MYYTLLRAPRRATVVTTGRALTHMSTTIKTPGIRIPGIATKTNIRLQQIARYRITGRIGDARIAELVGLTPPGLARILALPEYKELEESLLEGHISQMDEELSGNLEELRSNMRTAVPLALRSLVETVQQRRDLRAALAAAKEIIELDPDRTFTKVSKNTDNAPSSEFNPGATGDAKLVASIVSHGNAVAMEIRATNGSNTTTTTVNTGDPKCSSVLSAPAKVESTTAQTSQTDLPDLSSTIVIGQA
jgi:hypothetical protein